MNVTLEKLLEAIAEANRIFLAIYGSDGLVVAYARVSKRGIIDAFSARRNLFYVFKGLTHNQRTAEYCIQYQGKDLYIR